jgi:hypothetical protein
MAGKMVRGPLKIIRKTARDYLCAPLGYKISLVENDNVFACLSSKKPIPRVIWVPATLQPPFAKST